MLVEGSSTKLAMGIIGVASLALGVAETASGDPFSFMGPVNVAAGGTLLVVLWVGQRISKVAEKFFEEQGAKLISLPTAAMLEADKESLFRKLELFAHEAGEERKTTAHFHQELVRTLADHSARLTNLERHRTEHA